MERWWEDFTDEQMADPLSMEEWEALRQWHIEREIDAKLDAYEQRGIESLSILPMDTSWDENTFPYNLL